MDINIIFNIVGGLALFIYGISVMGEGLQNAAGERVKTILKALTFKPWIGICVGVLITSIIQSSSATSVLAIGFVNAELMSFVQALPIILGANIGTTVTAQIIAFKFTHYALPILAVGFFIYFSSKKRTVKNFGYFLLGLGVLFLGLSIMTSALKPLASNPALRNMFIKYSNNVLLAIIIGAITTAIIQSSSATTGIIIALASSNLLTIEGAIPLILGCNIGTCITALIASIGTNINAKRTALSHVVFNMIGVLIFLPLITPFKNIVIYTSTDIARQCANAHTIFNVVGTLVFLPFVNLYAKSIIKLLPGEPEEIDCLETKYLEPHLLNTPSIAIEATIKEIIRMLNLTKSMVTLSVKSLNTNKINHLSTIDRKEQAVDTRRYSIIAYLVSLMEHPMSHEESLKIPKIMHIASDIERIGDHAINLKKLAIQQINEKISLSSEASIELTEVSSYIFNMFEVILSALSSKTDRVFKLNTIRMLENNINKARDKYKNNYIKRLKDKKCDVKTGVIFIDTLSNFEKIGDHITNIGQAIT